MSHPKHRASTKGSTKRRPQQSGKAKGSLLPVACTAASATLSVGLVFGVVANYDVPVESPTILLTTGEGEDGGTAPGGTAPGGTAPGGTAPGGTAPGGTAPGGTAPGTSPSSPSSTSGTGTTGSTSGPGILNRIFTGFMGANGNTGANRSQVIFGNGRPAQRNAPPPVADPPTVDPLAADQQVDQLSAVQRGTTPQGTTGGTASQRAVDQGPPPGDPTIGAQDQPQAQRLTDPISLIFGGGTPGASLVPSLDFTLFNKAINGEIENFDDPNTPEEENDALALIPEDHTGLQGAVDLVGLVGATFLHSDEMCANSAACTARLDKTRSKQTTPVPGVSAGVSAWIDERDLGLVQGDYFSESFGSHPFRDSVTIITGQPASIPFVDALDAFLVQEDGSWGFVDDTPIRTFVAKPETRPLYYANVTATVGGILGLLIPGA